jgi:hypothetical protein
MAQQQIEQQLISFNDSLWVPEDTTLVLSKKEQKKVARTTSKADGVTTDNKTSVKEKKTTTPKPEMRSRLHPNHRLLFHQLHSIIANFDNINTC